MQADQGNGTDTQWLAGSVRLETAQSLGEGLRLDAAYVGGLRGGPRDTAYVSEALEEASTRGFRIGDLGARSYRDVGSGNSLQYRQNLDRLALHWKLKEVDIDAGRQAITWGVARGIRPLEFITQKRLSSLDTEERNGVDAVRMRVPTGGGLGEWDAGAAFGRNFAAKQSAAWLRNVTVIADWELTGLVGRFLDQGIVGGGASTSINKVGVRFEAVHVDARGFAGVGTKGYARATVGGDYAFNRNSYVFAEYHFNGAGAATSAEVPRLHASPGFAAESLLLLRRHYAVVGLTDQLSPAVKLSGYTICGLDDHSCILAGSVQYNVDEGWYLGASLTAGTGSRPSEFGSAGRAAVLSLGRYF